MLETGSPRSTSLSPATSENSNPISLDPLDTFLRRHLGPSPKEVEQMLDLLDFPSLDALIDQTVPEKIRLRRPLNLPAPRAESTVLHDLKKIASKNQIFRSFIGMGYYDCLTPGVIQRNILENPGWYTAYTPYQAEIAQGRLEALLNFQTMIIDLTGLEVANASLLDEATAAAEAMNLCHAVRKNPQANLFLVSKNCHPQTIDVVVTRAKPLGIQVEVVDESSVSISDRVFGGLIQYPGNDGSLSDPAPFAENLHQAGALAVIAADIMALTLLKSPGELGFDIAVGSTQRFGVPMGYGGPHAAYFATRDAYKRQMPGRLIGVSKDAQGKPALRLSLQTREQHIRRDKATSNICTAQVLLAVIASMYAVYHGPDGLRAIAGRIHRLTQTLAAHLIKLSYTLGSESYFDTLRVNTGTRSSDEIIRRALDQRINLRRIDDHTIGISLDEATTREELNQLVRIFDFSGNSSILNEPPVAPAFPASLQRQSSYLQHPVFNSYHTETELLRYMRRLESRDLSLTTSMIPLGSCTMKLNATTEMFPVTWPEFSKLHPFVPLNQAEGYQILFKELESWLAEITGFDRISLQPNAGSQGEYAGLLAIRDFHVNQGQGHRDICLIPVSAHGTNPASAVMAGFKVVPVSCDTAGNIDMADLQAKAQTHADRLAAIMVTYPSTHGVFEETIVDVCRIVHEKGGLVYMDGANLNAQVGLCRPADFGADVCHLNLHKTFCIPHGGGGPGVGPIGVTAKLAPFLPGHAVISPTNSPQGAVSAAPWGSASITVISWAYIAMLGAEGLVTATKIAILNANYIAKQLEPHFPVLYKGKNDLVAHECILDLRHWKKAAEIEVEDVAKRLMDYGFHAPTMSWPVPGTIMVEPTESESKQELDRFCDAMIAIYQEIQAVASGEADRSNNVLKNAPHTAQVVCADRWDRPYSRELAAFPNRSVREHKFWPVVGRIDNVHGDRNLICSCLPMEAYQDV